MTSKVGLHEHEGMHPFVVAKQPRLKKIRPTKEDTGVRWLRTTWILTVFGGMYFYHSMFHAKAQRGFWLKLFTASDSAAITASAAYGAATHLDLAKGRAELRGGRHVLWLWVGCLSGGARSVAAAPLLLG